MFNFEGFTIDTIYHDIAQAFAHHSTGPSPRGMLTKELSPAILTLHLPNANILTNPKRNASKAFMGAELLWMTFARTDVDMLAFYNQNIAKYSDDGKNLAGAYGPRIMPQFVYAFDTLKRDPDSRQAVITIWKPMPGPSKDIPCTVMMHFLLRHGKLDLIVYMRSNDFWLGLPYDVHNFTCFQLMMAKLLEVEVGKYYHMVGSLHLYQDHFEEANFLPKWSTSGMTPDPVWKTWQHWQEVLDMAGGLEMKLRMINPSNFLGMNWSSLEEFEDPFYRQKLQWLFQKARSKHEAEHS